MRHLTTLCRREVRGTLRTGHGPGAGGSFSQTHRRSLSWPVDGCAFQGLLIQKTVVGVPVRPGQRWHCPLPAFAFAFATGNSAGCPTGLRLQGGWGRVVRSKEGKQQRPGLCHQAHGREATMLTMFTEGPGCPPRWVPTEQRLHLLCGDFPSLSHEQLQGNSHTESHLFKTRLSETFLPMAPTSSRVG